MESHLVLPTTRALHSRLETFGRISPLEAAHEIFSTRFSQADVVFLAGSIVRGFGTPFSDLDLVVLFDEVPNAYKTAFMHKGWPVEAFVNDFSTAKYFFEIDVKNATPTLPQMIYEGIEVPCETTLSRKLKKLAQEILGAGPQVIGQKEWEFRRYAVTDRIDDLRGATGHDEIIALGSALYEQLADFYFRSKGQWTAVGKAIPRKMAAVDPQFAHRFEVAFHDLFANKAKEEVIAIADEIIQYVGGRLFEGYRRDAPGDWRRD